MYEEYVYLRQQRQAGKNERLTTPLTREKIEMDELAQGYKRRDLLQTYFYKIACRVLGEPKTRRRVVIAPPMREVNNAQKSPTGGQHRPKKIPPLDPVLTTVNLEPSVKRWAGFPGVNETEENWVKHRKAFRRTLNGIGNVTQWINNKPTVTELELKVAEREKTRPESHQVRAERPMSPELMPLQHRIASLVLRVRAQAPDGTDVDRELSPDYSDILKYYQQRRKRAMTEDEVLLLLRTVGSGSPLEDAHSSPSTLAGAPGRSIDHYRRQALGEYLDSLEMCRQHGVNVTQSSMQRVLLHPGDKVVQLPVGGGIRQAGASPIQGCGGRLRGGQVRSTGPVSREEEVVVVEEEEPRRRIRMEKSLYPFERAVRKEPKVMSLSTGRAEIRHKTECWLTREEYALLSGKQMSTRRADPNAFWPGQDDHIRLYQPEVGIPPETCLFECVSREPAPAVGSWPLNDKGYYTSGDIDGRKAYAL
ncbi:EF-hand calcium-binding domain-containing protein 12 [Engraulis encrasicolus]|uniref:EF-hand calcium-binding domain-containing protein 12 n=1 Tax=Engraulis encrasicolus TaxID=184585 RepID=UPI002FD5A485